MPKVLTVWKAAGNQVGLSQEADWLNSRSPLSFAEPNSGEPLPGWETT